MNKLAQKAIRIHQWLAIAAGVGLLIWGLSGLLHPLMTTFGRQQEVFMPPQRAMNLQNIQPIHQTLQKAGIHQAAAVKVIVGQDQNLLQVTEAQDVPRRYFDLTTGKELPDHDRSHAIYLARYYMNLPNDPIKEVRLVTEFSSEYPAVNRLLPVYRIQFDRADGLLTYVYTETNVLAGVTDSWKSSLQKLFQWFHTWSWMPQSAEWIRILLMGFLVGSIVLMAFTGVVMLVLIRRAVMAPGSRGWHRIAAYALAIPTLAFSASGFYHLIQYGWDQPVRNLKLSPAINFTQHTYPIHQHWTEISSGLRVNGVSLVQTADGQPLYRLALAMPKKDMPVTDKQIRNARFDGIEKTGPALYMTATQGQPWEPGDKELALQLGERFTGVNREAIKNIQLVTRFGPGYDFRNKRLPVWQLDYGSPINSTIFVDTATGVLADVTLDSAKPERWSFSFLHKWNFLFPLGRDWQNIIVSSSVILILGFMAGIGLQMEIKRRRRLKR